MARTDAVRPCCRSSTELTVDDSGWWDSAYNDVDDDVVLPDGIQCSTGTVSGPETERSKFRGATAKCAPNTETLVNGWIDIMSLLSTLMAEWL
jgi:hypothetical protein